MIRTSKDSHRKTLQALLAVATCVAALIGCTDDDEPEPIVKIIAPANGSSVKGPDIFLRISKTHFMYAAGKTTAAQHDMTGHIHIFLDKPAGLDANSIDHFDTADTLTLKGVATGAHYLIVQGAEAGHDDIESMYDSVSFTVTAP